MIVQDEGHFKIQDLQSRNGTLVNAASLPSIGSVTAIASAWGLPAALPNPGGEPEPAELLNLTTKTSPCRPRCTSARRTRSTFIPRSSPRKIPFPPPSAAISTPYCRSGQSVPRHPRPGSELQEQVYSRSSKSRPAEDGAILLDRHGEFSLHLALTAKGSEAPVRGQPHHPCSRSWRQGWHCCSTCATSERVRRRQEPGRLQVRSLLCVPLNVMDRVTGLRLHQYPEADVPFTEDQSTMVTALAAHRIGCLRECQPNSIGVRQENRRLITESTSTTTWWAIAPPSTGAASSLPRRPTETTVLIRGESGHRQRTSRSCHSQHSRRAEKPSCHQRAAITETLPRKANSSGHRKGAFTGSYPKKRQARVCQGGTGFPRRNRRTPARLQASSSASCQERELDTRRRHSPIPGTSRPGCRPNRNLEDP